MATCSPSSRDQLSPQVIFVDVTFPSRMEFLAKLTGHLTPNMLREQVLEASKAKLRLPKMVAVHMNVPTRDEVIPEVESIANELELT